MRISNSHVDVSATISKSNVLATSSQAKGDVKQGSETHHVDISKIVDIPKLSPEQSEVTKEKVQDAVTKMNEMLELTNSTSKFLYHEGLDRYYVSVVDRETEEVVKEIPPKKLLDAFYEMQKMLGMIVDEKI